MSFEKQVEFDFLLHRPRLDGKFVVLGVIPVVQRSRRGKTTRRL